jgi:hypothetical protein
MSTEAIKDVGMALRTCYLVLWHKSLLVTCEDSRSWS